MAVRRRQIGVLGVSLAACGLAFGAGAAQADTVTFLPTGAEQTFTVPAGVTSVRAIAVGGRGGTGNGNPRAGGFGALAAADLPVTPGQVPYVEVGGNGGSLGAGGFNGGADGGISGGGAGGGASDVRSAPRAAGSSLLTRLITAAGGGGSGGGVGAGGTGDGAGGPADGDGKDSFGSSGGQKGTLSSGGAGGSGCETGGSGALGVGGRGGGMGMACGGFPEGGGGGGGGIYGGGGGASSSLGAGGGGGSSGFASSASNSSLALDNTGSPSITLEYTAPAGGGGGGGGGGGSTTPPPDTIKPKGSALRVSPAAFRPFRSGGPVAQAARGTAVSYQLSEAASVRFSVARALPGRRVAGRCVRPRPANVGRPRCTRYSKLRGGFTRASAAGSNGFRFTGRLRGRALRPGVYRLSGVPTDAAGNRGRRFSTKFTIRR